MHPESTIATLRDLSQYEIDAVKSYPLVLSDISDPTARDHLYHLMVDQERHILEMGEVLRSLEVEPPAFARDVRGQLMAFRTAMRGTGGPSAAIAAVRATITATLARYAHHQEQDLPVDVAAQLERNAADLYRHRDALAALPMTLAPSSASSTGEPDIT